MLLGGGWGEVEFLLVVPGSLELMRRDVLRKMMGRDLCTLRRCKNNRTKKSKDDGV